jgi:hypothetical protein
MFGKEQILTTRILMEDCTFETTEEQEIDIQSIEEINLFDNGQGYNNIKTITGAYDSNFGHITDKFNELIKSVKQLDKKINE